VNPAWEEYDPSSGNTTLSVELCALGDKFLAVSHKPSTALTTTITGELETIPYGATWVDQGYHNEPLLQGKTIEQFVDTNDGRPVGLAFGTILTILGVLAWPAYFVWKKRNRALFDLRDGVPPMPARVAV
jgi:hypothetical protein